MSATITLTTDRLKDSFLNQSKVTGRNVTDLQILIGTKPETEGSTKRIPVYYILEDMEYEHRKQVTYREMLGRIDILQGGTIAREKFPEQMQKIAQKLKLNYEQVELMVIAENNDLKRLGILVFENKQYKTNISFDQFFGEEEI